MAPPSRSCDSCNADIPGDAITCPSCGALSSPNVDLESPDVIAAGLQAALGARYAIERPIGEGGMAIVFLARDFKHDRHVAIKVLRPSLARFLGPDRFIREIRIAAHLDHPGIVGLHDSGEAGGYLYYVMPFFDGESLRDRIQREGPLPVAEVLRIVCEVADALEVAHEEGIIHRDIKPANILLGRQGRAALADFGIARALAAVPGAPGSTTTTGPILGTPAYMSPEQASGEHALDRRSDIYALACVAFDMLTGQPPYDGPEHAVMARHRTAPIPSVRGRRHDIPLAVDLAIRRAMAKRPGERFSTVTEFAQALGRHSALAAVARSIGRGLRLHPLRVVVGAAAAAAVLWVLAGRGRGPATPSPIPRPRLVVTYFSAPATPDGRRTADAITRDLTDDLQRVTGMDLAGSDLVQDYRDSSLDAMRRRFPATHFVTGTLDDAGGRLHLQVRLLDAVTGRQLATDSIVRVPTSAAPAALAEAAGAFVRSALWEDIERRARRLRTRDSLAADLVEAARRETSRDVVIALGFRARREALRLLDHADSLLGVAERRDPGSALPPVERARLHDLRGLVAEYLQLLVPDTTGLPEPAAERRSAAAILDRVAQRWPEDADGFALRGEVRLSLWRLAADSALLGAAIADLERATSLQPRAPRAWRQLSKAYLTAGRYPGALLAIRNAQAADEFQVMQREILRGAFEASLLNEEWRGADSACAEGRRRFPGDPRFESCELERWSRAAGARADAARAVRTADSLGRMDPAPANRALFLLYAAAALAHAGMGDSSDALATRAASVAGAPAVPLSSLLLLEAAHVRLLRGDVDSAITLARAAVRAEPSTRQNFLTEPRFRALPRDATRPGRR
jgi:serine/threonine-protein kinase